MEDNGFNMGWSWIGKERERNGFTDLMCLEAYQNKQEEVGKRKDRAITRWAKTMPTTRNEYDTITIAIKQQCWTTDWIKCHITHSVISCSACTRYTLSIPAITMDAPTVCFTHCLFQVFKFKSMLQSRAPFSDQTSLHQWYGHCPVMTGWKCQGITSKNVGI